MPIEKRLSRGAGVRGCLAICAMLAFVTAASAQSDKKADLGVFAPPNAIALVGVTDLDEAIDSFKKSSGYRVFSDPAFKNSPGQFGFVNRMVEQFMQKLAKALGTETDKLKNPFGGPLAIVLLPPAGESKEPGVVIVVGVKNKELMKEYYTKAQTNFKNIATKHETVDFGSNTIDHFTTRAKSADEKKEGEKKETDFDPNSIDFSSEEGMAKFMDKTLAELFTADSLPESFATCLTDERLVVSMSPDEIKNVFRREKGADSLKDHEDFKAISRHFESPGPFRLFVNIQQIFEIAKAENPEGHKEAMAIFGGKSMRSLIGHAAYMDGKTDSRTECLLLTSGERTGLMKILTPKNKPVAAPGGVGNEAAFFGSAALSVPEILDEVERMIRTTDPEAADSMRDSMQSVPLGENETISPRKDIIDNLREPITMAMGFAKPYSPQSPRFHISIGHKNKAAMERVIEKVRTLAGFSDRDVKGNTVYDTPFGLSLGITNDTAYFGSAASIDTAIQGGDDASISGDPEFKRCLEIAPKEAWFVFYTDARRMYEAAAELAKHKDAMMQQGMTGNVGAMAGYGMLTGLLGDSEKPDADGLRRLAELQGSGMATIATTSDGIRITIFNLAPKK